MDEDSSSGEETVYIKKPPTKVKCTFSSHVHAYTQLREYSVIHFAVIHVYKW